MDSLSGIGALFLLFIFLASVSWAKGKLRDRADENPAAKAEK